MKALLFLVVAVFSLNVSANSLEKFDEHSKKFYSIEKAELMEVPVDESTLKSYALSNMHMSCQDDLAGSNLIFDKGAAVLDPIKEEVKVAVEIVDEAGKVVDGIINIGKKVWEIIVSGQPVMNLNLDNSANALPRGVRCWDQLSNWQVPAVRSYSQSFKNYFGIEVIRFDFDVVFTYGGDLDGKGNYLTNVQVHPRNVYVGWGFGLDASVDIPSLVNLGSVDQPVAGMQVDVKWQATSPLTTFKQGISVFVQGDGKSKILRESY